MIVRAALMAAFCLSLAACSTREVKPAEAEIDRVEAALAANACIGSVDTWQRAYFYHAKYFGEEVAEAKAQGRAPRASGHVRTLIGFDLRQGGANVAGRSSVTAPMADSGAGEENGQRRALGSFDLRNGALEMARCDPKTR